MRARVRATTRAMSIYRLQCESKSHDKMRAFVRVMARAVFLCTKKCFKRLQIYFDHKLPFYMLTFLLQLA